MTGSNKTICFFNTNLAWGGGEKWHFETAKLMHAQGHQVVVFAHPKGLLLQKAKEAGFETKSQIISNLSFVNFFTLKRLSKKLKQCQIDTIITNLASDMKAGCIAASWANIPNIIYRRGTALTMKNSWINRHVFQNVLTTCITNSTDIKNKILYHNSQMVQADKIHVIENYISKTKDESNLPVKLPNNEKLILSNAGRLVGQKGQKYLIELARELKKQDIPFEIHIAGKGPLETALKKSATEAKVDDVIVWHGFVEDMKSFIEKTDVFVFPSLHEGISNVMLEVMNIGRPIVAFDVSSMPEIIINEVTGYLIPYDDIKVFSKFTNQLMENPQLRQKMGLEAKQRIAAKFNEQKFVESFEKLI